MIGAAPTSGHGVAAAFGDLRELVDRVVEVRPSGEQEHHDADPDR